MKRFLVSTIIVAALLALGACAGANIPDAKPTTGRNPQLAEHPSADETVRGEDDPAVVTLELGNALHERRLSEGESLPGNIIVPTTNLNAVPVTAALQAVLTGTDVSLSWDTGTLATHLVTVMNLSGPLPRVVDRICSSAKVFCSYRHGSLELAERDTFVVPLPPISRMVSAGGATGASSSGGSSGGSAASIGAASTTNSMVQAIGQLVGGKVQVDEQAGNVLYTADVVGEERVSHYLDALRNGRPLIILQLYVWEVTLSKENGEGVNWQNIKLEDIGPGAARLALAGTSAFTSLAGVSGSTSIGAVTTGHLNTNALFSFLSTQGRVQTISNPQVTFVSGGGAELRVGGKLRYISQVGQLVSATNTSGTTNPTTNSGLGSNTVSTDSIDTGLSIAVAGSYDNNVVFANLDLSLTNLVSLNPTASGGGTIDLPETSDEKINTVIRVRPGDNLVMAGLVSSADTNSRQGVPLPGDARLPTYGDDQLNNRELVIVIKPSVVLFSDNLSKAEAKQKEEGKPLPDAMLIDKNGAKPIALAAPGINGNLLPPASRPSADMPSSLLPSAYTPGTKPVLVPSGVPQTVPEPAPASVPLPASIPVSPVDNGQPIPLTDPAAGSSTDAAPVDKRMMQRGFSHAFDQLLQPTSASGNSFPPATQARP